MVDDDDRDEARLTTSELSSPPRPLPPAVRRAQITVLSGPDHGRKITLGAGITVVGRGAGASVALRDPRVSRAHARIYEATPGRFVVQDTQSRYGTFLNGETIVRAALVSGDRIVLGDTALLFDYRDAEADRALEREQLEMVGRLGAGLVHDMNNLLYVSMLSAESLRALLDEPHPSPEARAEAIACVDAIERATQRGRDLTSHLLRLARRQPIETTELDLSALVGETLDLGRRTMGKHVELLRSVEEGIHVVGNRGELHRLLMNLVLNARDAMPNGGRVEVSLRGARDSAQPAVDPADASGRTAMARLIVRDSGAGMDAETRAQIFEPLFTTKESGRGTGLGLATVSQVVAAHGGRIRCESAPGAGTVMEITLPRSSRDAPSTRATPAPPTRP